MSVVALSPREAEARAKLEIEAINQLHEEVFRAVRMAVTKAVELGNKLQAVKDSLPHGRFGSWVTENCNFDDRLARRYMAVASGWPLLVESVGTTAYVLSLDAAINKINSLKKETADAEARTVADPEACPHGGEHEYDEEACVRCHDPRPQQSPARGVAGLLEKAIAHEKGASDRDGDEGSDSEGEETAGVAAQRLLSLFTNIDQLYAQLTQLLDQAAQQAPSRYKDEAQEGLDISYQDFRKWKKEVL
jgi:hypothetical protein